MLLKMASKLGRLGCSFMKQLFVRVMKEENRRVVDPRWKKYYDSCY